MTPDIDGKLFAAALGTITHIWGRDMGDEQRFSLANQIVREIERRNIVGEIIGAEREACARIASAECGDSDCDNRGAVDLETGEVPCRAERRGEPCVCAEIAEASGRIASRIRSRKG